MKERRKYRSWSIQVLGERLGNHMVTSSGAQGSRGASVCVRGVLSQSLVAQKHTCLLHSPPSLPLWGLPWSLVGLGLPSGQGRAGGQPRVGRASEDLPELEMWEGK